MAAQAADEECGSEASDRRGGDSVPGRVESVCGAAADIYCSALACLAFYQNRVVGQPGLETHPSIGETNGKESGRHLQTEISRMISDAQGASQER
jgi:hypothetical protein